MGQDMYSRSDLLGFVVGILDVDGGAEATGDQYWLDNGKPRDVHVNYGWFGSPRDAFTRVRHRGWLLQHLLEGDGQSTDFRALAHPPPITLNVLNSGLKPGDGKNWGADKDKVDAFRDLLKPSKTPPQPPKKYEDSGVRRSFESHVTFGASCLDSDKDSTLVLGVGFRQILHHFGSTEGPTGPDALYFSLEWYLPFAVLTADGAFEAVDETSVPDAARRRFEIGLALLRNGGSSSLATNPSEKAPNGLRVSAGVALSAGGFSASPDVVVQKYDGSRPYQASGWRDAGTDWWPIANKIVGDTDSAAGDWANFKYAKELIHAPINPIRVLDPDFPSKDKPKDAWQKFKDSGDALQDAGTSRGGKRQQPTQPRTAKPGVPPVSLDTQQSTLQSFLYTVGLLQKSTNPSLAKSLGEKTESVYPLKPLADLEKLDFWQAAAAFLQAGDGLPLFNYGLAFGKPAPQSQKKRRKPDTPAPWEPRSTIQVMLASAGAPGDTQTTSYGLRGMVQNIPVPRTLRAGAERGWLAQLGNWFSRETDADNWFRRLLPGKVKAASGAPGLGVFPLTLIHDGNELIFDQRWRLDLISFGADLVGLTDKGIYRTTGGRFRLAAAELRLLFSINFDNPPKVAWGFGVKADGIRLSFGGKKGKRSTEDPEDEMLGGMQEMFVVEPGQTPGAAEEGDRTTEGLRQLISPSAGRGTRSRSDQDKEAWKQGFGLSAGFLASPQGPRLDLQLYDTSGARGKVVWFPVDLRKGKVYVKSVGVGLRGFESGDPILTLAFTGGLHFLLFELGLIGAGVMLPVKRLGDLGEASVKDWLLSSKLTTLDGLDFAARNRSGTFDISGGLMRHTFTPPNATEETWEIAGELRVATRKLTLGAMGAFGPLPKGGVSFFLYAFLSAGEGLGNSIVKVTGGALGGGFNRKVLMPAIDKVEDFTLVSMVMTPKEGDEAKDPMDVLFDMTNEVVEAPGEYFGCLGLKFLLFEQIDCFALAVAQGKAGDVEVALVGIGRTQIPLTGKAYAYAELELEADFHLDTGSFLFQAELSPNSWLIDTSCRLTGGFAAGFWFDGEHAGDFVYSQGGYHPRFQRPSHYPSVPRIGFDWKVDDHLSFAGGVYFAVTPSCFMAGGRFVANFHAGPMAAWFTLYGDFLINWLPFHYLVDAHVSIRVEVSLLFTIHAEIGVSIDLMGPPMHGVAHLEVGPVSKDIRFGEQPDPPAKVTWPGFGRHYLDRYQLDGTPADTGDDRADGKWTVPDADKIVEGPDICRLGLVRGQHVSPRPSPNAAPKTAAGGGPWIVRGDELVLSAGSRIPAAELKMGKASDLSIFTRIEQAKQTGDSLTLGDDLGISDSTYSDRGATIGIRPMGRTDAASTLSVTVVKKVGDEYEDHSFQWTVENAETAVSHALWGTDNAKNPAPQATEPDATLVAGALTGADRLAAPAGGERGMAFGPFDAGDLGWDDLDPRDVTSTASRQPAPAPYAGDVGKVLVSTREKRERIAGTLREAGFGLPRPTGGPAAFPAGVKLRKLLAPPLERSK